jgi:hypothetical protein
MARARNLYLEVLSGGWEAALATLHGTQRPAPQPEATVGKFLDELKAKADLNPETLKGYVIAFRAIVADIFKIEGGKEKFDYRSGGRARWVAKIDNIASRMLPPHGCRNGNGPSSHEPVMTRSGSAQPGPASIHSCGGLRACSARKRLSLSTCRSHCQHRYRLPGSASSPAELTLPVFDRRGAAD